MSQCRHAHLVGIETSEAFRHLWNNQSFCVIFILMRSHFKPMASRNWQQYSQLLAYGSEDVFPHLRACWCFSLASWHQKWRRWKGWETKQEKVGQILPYHPYHFFEKIKNDLLWRYPNHLPPTTTTVTSHVSPSLSAQPIFWPGINNLCSWWFLMVFDGFWWVFLGVRRR